MIKYIMILVFGLSLFLPVAVQAGTTPITVAIIKCCMDDGAITVAITSANGDFPAGDECRINNEDGCAVCIQALLDFSLDLRQIDVEDICSWYHFFDNDRKDFDR